METQTVSSNGEVQTFSSGYIDNSTNVHRGNVKSVASNLIKEHLLSMSKSDTYPTADDAKRNLISSKYTEEGVEVANILIEFVSQNSDRERFHQMEGHNQSPAQTEESTPAGRNILKREYSTDSDCQSSPTSLGSSSKLKTSIHLELDETIPREWTKANLMTETDAKRYEIATQTHQVNLDLSDHDGLFDQKAIDSVSDSFGQSADDPVSSEFPGDFTNEDIKVTRYLAASYCRNCSAELIRMKSSEILGNLKQNIDPKSTLGVPLSPPIKGHPVKNVQMIDASRERDAERIESVSSYTCFFGHFVKDVI